MAWKKKEKALEPEEALAIAKAEATPYWIGSDPIFIAGNTEAGRVSIFSLDPAFSKGIWLLLFFDIFDYAGELGVSILNEWFRRFDKKQNQANVRIIGVIRSDVVDDNPDSLNQIIAEKQISFPILNDHDGLIVKGFGVKKTPTLLIFFDSKLLLERDGLKWYDGIETRIHALLRSNDPGLPLLPEFDISEKKFTKPILDLNLASGHGAKLSRDQGQRVVEPGEVLFDGKCDQNKDRMVVTERGASIRFSANCQKFSVVAQSEKPSDTPVIQVELNGVPVPESLAGAHLSYTDEGMTILKVGSGKLYHVIAAPTMREVEIKLIFQGSSTQSVGIYSLHFGE